MKHHKFLLILGLAILFLAACGGAAQESAPATAAATAVPTKTAVPQPTATEKPAPTAEAQATTEPAPEATAVPTETAAGPATEPPPAQPITEEVTIEGADGLALKATYYGTTDPTPRPGVILLHMLGSDRRVWAENGFAGQLVQNGYVALAVDMRGHGETGGSRDWNLAAEDLQRVWAYFSGREEVDGEKTAVVGASIGANMALITGANEPAIKTVVLLSPGLDYRGVSTGDQIVAYGQRPLLIVASQEDSYAAESSTTLAESAAGEARLEMYTGAGHGTNMFNAQPELADLIIEWLNQTVMNPET